MLNDIISGHRERMLNLKKYYPFFKLTEISFSQFKDGKYELLDMGYIVMGILRFFIEENNFKEKEVTYPEYLEFISTMLVRDFGLSVNDDESREIADYIFDKLKNEGRPFDFEYFDPIDKKKRVSRVRMIESTIRNNTVWYSISSDAVEFYLDTKEIRDESRISVQQLLLEKMIRAQNFKGGTEVVERINEEVNRLQLKKNEVVNILATDIFAGLKAYEDFVSTGMQWFEEEEKLFKKNSELIVVALERFENADSSRYAADGNISGGTGNVSMRSGGRNQGYYKSLNDIYELQNQLKVAMNRHGELLRACTDMQKLTDDAVRRAKLGRLRSQVNFGSMLKECIKTDNAEILSAMISPLFKPKIKKTFNLNNIDEALTIKPLKYVMVEMVNDEEPEEIIFDDELEDRRIAGNYIFIMNNLLQCMKQKQSFTLKQFNEAMSKAYSPDLLRNADYYSFFVNLCQKKEYTIGGTDMEKDSFLDDILKNEYNGQGEVRFTITMSDSEKLELFEGCEMSDVTFETRVYGR